MAFKIYTKTGDQGETALIGGIRVPKSHIRIDAYGTIDELNSWLGNIRDIINTDFSEELFNIQNYLFTIGSHLATSSEKTTKMSLPEIKEAQIDYLEDKIDTMEKELPPLKNFVLPGGNENASKIHIARCVCRRAERIVVALSSQDNINPSIIQYLNRLSDYLFVLARYVLMKNKGTEVIWNA